MGLTNVQAVQQLDATSGSKWKTIGVKVKESELGIFNKQLQRFGWQTLGDLVKDLMVGKIERMSPDKEIEIMKIQAQAGGLLTSQLSGDYSEFYKKIDHEDFKQWLKNNYHERTARSYCNYFLRYSDIFFGPNPANELFKLAPHKRSWIIQSMRRFGDYYFFKYGTKDVKQVILRLIERYNLNRDLDQKDRIYLVDNGFIREKINKILAIPGDMGFVVKIGLFSGLREDEARYIHGKEICENNVGCRCDKLHVVHKQNGITGIGINWIRGNKKCYLTLMPTSIWQKFRERSSFSEAEQQAANKITKHDAGILYIAMRKIHYNVMRSNAMMTFEQADVLAGRAKSTSAQFYVAYELDKMAEKYKEAWQRFGVNTDELAIV
jgi:intergrase/recombinase